MTLDGAGSLYGTTQTGGANGYGNVYKLASNGTFTDLFDFSNANGAYPASGVTLDSAGSLYGTTYQGGANGYGNVYKLASNGTFTNLFDFNNANGANPYGGVTLDSAGNLYGTTYNGGANGVGTVFEIATPEPGSVALLAGLLVSGTTLLARRRRKSVTRK